ncbi:BsuPI-related putative proteinase inhibitor [Bacillus sp. JJ1562]|uniref:BsuPI-related putative proteinase inhibitor n=1 Tax=Bacillus sp. JJ1562 TaxID=3122960 RepID=UPI003001AE56
MEKFVVSCISILLLAGIILTVQLTNEEKDLIEDEEQTMISNSKGFDMQVNDRRMQHILGGSNFSENIGNSNLNATLLIKSQSEKEITLVYEVKNVGQNSIALEYSSNQKYEYELHNKDSGERKRYSEGKNFLDVKNSTVLLPNKSLSYEVTFSDLEKGEYVFSMWITAVDGISTLKRITFSLSE